MRFPAQLVQYLTTMPQLLSPVCALRPLRRLPSLLRRISVRQVLRRGRMDLPFGPRRVLLITTNDRYGNRLPASSRLFRRSGRSGSGRRGRWWSSDLFHNGRFRLWTSDIRTKSKRKLTHIFDITNRAEVYGGCNRRGGSAGRSSIRKEEKRAERSRKGLTASVAGICLICLSNVASTRRPDCVTR